MLLNSPTPALLQAGYYISPKGGPPTPFLVQNPILYIEILTKGRIYHPETHEVCGTGSVFTHCQGESTMYQTPEHSEYECLTLLFSVEGHHTGHEYFPRSFEWLDTTSLATFTREVLHAAHFEKMPLEELGVYVWATLQFRLSRSNIRERERSMPGPVAKVMDLMSSDCRQEWSLEELAEEAGWSTSHLHAEFKRAAESTPHQFLMRRRMAEARHRLVKTSDPVKEIAYDVGFMTTENFCRAFKKHQGQTASDFRRMYQAHPYQK